MDPITMSAIIGGASGLISNYASSRQSKRNKALQEQQNEMDRDFQRQMYDRSRQDAIADFHMQNQYNHPLQQMERLRQAGLNPNLIYGKGAENAAAQVKSANYQPQKQDAPQHSYDASLLGQVTNSLSLPYDLRAKQAQTDNLYKTAEQIAADTTYKQALTAKTSVETAHGSLNLGIANELRKNTIESSLLNTYKQKSDIMFQLNENERRNIATDLSKAKTMQDIKASGERILTERLNRQHTLLKMHQTRSQTSKTKTDELKVMAEIANIKQQLRLLQQTENIKDLEEYYAELGVPLSSPNPLGYLDRKIGDRGRNNSPYLYKPSKKRAELDAWKHKTRNP